MLHFFLQQLLSNTLGGQRIHIRNRNVNHSNQAANSTTHHHPFVRANHNGGDHHQHHHQFERVNHNGGDHNQHHHQFERVNHNGRDHNKHHHQFEHFNHNGGDHNHHHHHHRPYNNPPIGSSDVKLPWHQAHIRPRTPANKMEEVSLCSTTKTRFIVIGWGPRTRAVKAIGPGWTAWQLGRNTSGRASQTITDGQTDNMKTSIARRLTLTGIACFCTTIYAKLCRISFAK
ncbi:hypothetical protein DPMN_149050 [Dreissena polymorpha]|uniref:Uncharacterized protein n=1 Tax=Dreissena polymorpha TaxID=45954 RepID=A0A9D4FF76_DREPO|nr:hypothetical protein DPMN_149050 [Dreissena polymorpha]